MPLKVLANGCWDLLHYGHLRHLQAARKLGDQLIVSVTKDRSVNKGPGRPVFDQEQRSEMLRALACVDEVILVDSSIEALEKVRPQVFVKGKEYTERLREEDDQYCARNSVQVVFTDEPTYSSTKLLSFYDRARQG